MAILQSSRKEDNDIERLQKSVIGEANAGAPSFRNLPARLSISALFEGFTSSKYFRKEACVVGGNEKLFPSKLVFSQYFLTASFPNLKEKGVFLTSHLLNLSL